MAALRLHSVQIRPGRPGGRRRAGFQRATVVITQRGWDASAAAAAVPADWPWRLALESLESLEAWKPGRLGGWKAGRLEGWKPACSFPQQRPEPGRQRGSRRASERTVASRREPAGSVAVPTWLRTPRGLARSLARSLCDWEFLDGGGGPFKDGL